jgi:RNA polymerase sigma factor (sigma-70 family)
MIEDELLKWKFKCGSKEALRCIYEKYLNNLLTLAMVLLNDANAAEDVVHDVFVSFAKGTEEFKLRGSLKGYLATCVINRARDRNRTSKRQPVHLEESDLMVSDTNGPDESVICTEEAKRLNQAISQLPDEQREVVIMHLKSNMKFKEIARLQGVSANTIQGRYRYGLNKLRSFLDGKVEK